VASGYATAILRSQECFVLDIILIVAAIGFFASNDGSVGGTIIAKLGLQGEAATIVNDAIKTAATNPQATGPIALVGLLWSGLGLVNALQYAIDQVWQVEERGLRDKLFGVLWLIGAGVLFVGASAITTALNWLPGFMTPLGIVIGLGVNFALWLWSFKVLPNRDLPLRALVPGAILGALGMEALKFIGAFYLPRTVANSSALYGSIGVVFAVLAWLLVFSRLVVYASVLNVVRWERRVGTVETAIEVPAGRGIQPRDDVTRSGRVAAEDAAA
jgi:membrane protein